ncbi:unnamed protein product [Trichogramma brassicae]|uniref:Uncharacterized protein n=1 Tax=Trichogramma brassicae TaxID=86971 RepID=A0A6H5IA53_9HYME|nr:unnamed protein product [Trichogramma brassicae]
MADYSLQLNFREPGLTALKFDDVGEAHFHRLNFIMRNVYIRIFLIRRNGLIIDGIKGNIKLYPLDRSKKKLYMTMLEFTTGWTTADLVFLWKEGDPVQVVKDLPHLPRFYYSCLKVDLLFKREFSLLSHPDLHTLLCLVIVSWVSFWLDQSAVPARCPGNVTLLTMAHSRRRA